MLVTVQSLAREHERVEGHRMAVIDGWHASCGDCDYFVEKQGPLGVIVAGTRDG